MKLLYENNGSAAPEVSFILLDWSCRESFHTLQYLSDQSVSRGRYEIIWIEYYGRRSPEIEAGVKGCNWLQKPPVVDRWIVMEMPEEVCYHKHLMYNVGIVAARGKIVVFCDSDAIVTETFVESIIKSFEGDKDIVLHLDEVRNASKRFYPFNYPSLRDVTGRGCVNWTNGVASGLHAVKDALHALNYGACMCALREDLIAIGGADEHADYVGHVCGPYEMTFRLSSAGKREVWHGSEFLYHVWHPGTDGKNNYMGPHDGKNMSSTALEARKTRRVLPLVENTAIRMLRLREDEVIYAPLLEQAIPSEEMKNWTTEKLGQRKKAFWNAGEFMKAPFLNLSLTLTFAKMLKRQFFMKVTKFSRQPTSIEDGVGKVARAYDFFRNMAAYNNYAVERCSLCIKELSSQNVSEVAVCGTGDIAEILYKLTQRSPVRINAVYGFSEGKRFFDHRVIAVDDIRDYRGKVVVAALASGEEMAEILKGRGIASERIVLL